jgi:hypothetical protein
MGKRRSAQSIRTQIMCVRRCSTVAVDACHNGLGSPMRHLLVRVDRQLRLRPAALGASFTARLVRLGRLFMPLGLRFGRRKPPMRRAISSACAATIRCSSSATCSNNVTTKFWSSACERAVTTIAS